MAVKKILRLDGLAAKVEAAVGTDAVPTAADNAIRVGDGPIWGKLTVDDEWPNDRTDERNGSIIPDPSAANPTGRNVTLEIPWRIRGAGSAYAALNRPECSALLRACGWAETVDTTLGAEKVSYQIADENHEAATIYAWAGGQLFKIVACRGTITWDIVAAQLGYLKFQMRGILVDDPITASLPAFTFQATIPPAAQGMTYTLGGFHPDIVSSTFDQAAEVELLADVGAAQGIDEFDFGESIPTLQVNCFVPELSSFNPWTVRTAQAGEALAVVLGSAQYNKLELSDAGLYLAQQPRPIEQGKFAGYELNYRLSDPGLSFT